MIHYNYENVVDEDTFNTLSNISKFLYEISESLVEIRKELKEIKEVIKNANN